MNRNNFVDIINKNKYKICVEVGVQRGDFSSVLLTSDLEKIYLIDPWRYLKEYDDIANLSDQEQENIYQNVLERFKLNMKVEIIRKMSLEACEHFQDNTLDYVYLDADHSYEAVKSDIESWYKKIKIGGMLSGHDYLDGKIFAGDFGVKSAVDEFVKKNNLELFLTDEAEWKSWFFIKNKNI